MTFPVRTGHLYLDTRACLLYCLDETARELQNQGVPLRPHDLSRQPLHRFDGTTILPAQLPLWRAWRERRACKDAFVLTRPGAVAQMLAFGAVPLCNAGGKVVAVLGSVTLHPPEPDWEDMAALAHDLRSSLQTLTTLGPLLEGATLPPPLDEALARLRSAVD